MTKLTLFLQTLCLFLCCLLFAYACGSGSMEEQKQALLNNLEELKTCTDASECASVLVGCEIYAINADNKEEAAEIDQQLSVLEGLVCTESFLAFQEYECVEQKCEGFYIPLNEGLLKK